MSKWRLLSPKKMTLTISRLKTRRYFGYGTECLKKRRGLRECFLWKEKFIFPKREATVRLLFSRLDSPAVTQVGLNKGMQELFSKLAMLSRQFATMELHLRTEQSPRKF